MIHYQWNVSSCHLIPLMHGQFSDPRFKVPYCHMGIRNKKVLKDQEFSGMGCLKLLWVKGKKPQQRGEGRTAPSCLLGLKRIDFSREWMKQQYFFIVLKKTHSLVKRRIIMNIMILSIDSLFTYWSSVASIRPRSVCYVTKRRVTTRRVHWTGVCLDSGFQSDRIRLSLKNFISILYMD